MAENKSASFEASLARLQDIVRELESDQVDLERSVKLYQEGRQLVERCEQLLGDAEQALRNASGPGKIAPNTESGAPSSDDQLDEEIPF